MQRDFPESDWKLFRQLHAVALERYFRKAVTELQHGLADESKDLRDRFWDAAERIKEDRETLKYTFDDLRRSTALMQLSIMRARGLVTAEEMSRFSAETRQRVEAIERPPT